MVEEFLVFILKDKFWIGFISIWEFDDLDVQWVYIEREERVVCICMLMRSSHVRVGCGFA